MIWTKQPIKKEIDELHSKMSRNIDASSLADLETSIITIASAMSDASTCIGYARLNFTNSTISIISGMATVNISRRTSGIFITHIMQADGTLVTDYYHDNAHHWGSMKNEITALSSDKVNTSDIVNTLTDTSMNKPLSAAQGKALNDKYTSLNSNLTVSANVNVSYNTDAISSGSIRLHRIGRLVIVSLDFTTSQVISSNTVLATGLPETVGPVWFVVVGYDDNKSYRVRVSGTQIATYYSGNIPTQIYDGFVVYIAKTL